MLETLNAEEDQLRRKLEKVKEYPRWRYKFVRGSTNYKTFLLYTRPTLWIEEVAHRNGLWMAGLKWRGTLRLFSHLEDALFYAERLANLPIRVGIPVKGRLPARHSPINGRNICSEDRKRWDDIMLQ
jgi:hypothetical protein